MMQILGVIAVGNRIFLGIGQLIFVPEVFPTPLLSVSSGLLEATGGLVFLVSIVGCVGVFIRHKRVLLAV